jgi:long-subunit fatty acid transport protein
MRFRWIVIVAVVVLAARSSMALTDEEIFRDFRFNLINPGARSLALGGAFIAIADDATAAQANPAGLTLLRQSEYFGELRYVDNGVSAVVLEDTLPTGVNTIVATQTDPSDILTPSFLSVVFPVKQHWVLAGSRQEVLRTDNETLNSFAFTFPGSSDFFFVEGNGSIQVDVVNYNFSAGYRINDYVFVGGSLAWSRLDVQSKVQNSIVDTAGQLAGREILEPTVDLETSIDDTDDALAFNLGVMWRPLGTDKITFGAVYRHAPTFQVDEVIAPEGPDANGDTFPDSGIDIFNKRGDLGCDPAVPCTVPNTFNLPDSFGIGIGWQVNDSLVVTQDFEWIKYSDLTDGYVSGLNELTDTDASFTVDDALEYRIGVEYVLLKSHVPIAFRGGLFTAHDSTIRAVSTGTASFATPAAFPGKDDEIHATAGMGFVFGNGRFKLDAAADFASSANQYVLSFIFRGK